MAEVKHRAILQITPELLLELLQFKDGEIFDARVNNWDRSGFIELIIEHIELPEVKEGDCLTKISSSYTTTYSSTGAILDIKRQSLSHEK